MSFSHITTSVQVDTFDLPQMKVCDTYSGALKRGGRRVLSRPPPISVCCAFPAVVTDRQSERVIICDAELLKSEEI